MFFYRLTLQTNHGTAAIQMHGNSLSAYAPFVCVLIDSIAFKASTYVIHVQDSIFLHISISLSKLLVGLGCLP